MNKATNVEEVPSKATLKEKTYYGIMGGFIGDALGMPVEAKTAAEIIDLYGRVTTYLRPTRPGWENKKSGTFTDDTQLALVVMKSLTESGLNMQSLAEGHIKAYRSCQEGWGRTSTNAIKQLLAGVPISESGNHEDIRLGRSNGVIMKLFPLVAFMELNDTFSTEFLIEFTRLTHNTNEAIGSSLVFSKLIRAVLNSKKFNSKMLRQTILEAAPISTYPELYPWLLDAFTTKYVGGNGRERFSCHCSLAVTIQCFLQSEGEFNGVIKAVNYGGDTDTNAAMVGNLVGALHGRVGIPSIMYTGLDKNSLEEVKNTAEQFLA